MTPTPWAQAVEAFKTYAPCCECGMCVSDGLRAAAPHLLRAVTEGMEWERINALRVTLAEIPTEGRTDPEAYYVEYRTALLSALTDAAGRLR